MNDYTRHKAQYHELTMRKFEKGLSPREEKTRQYLSAKLDLIEMKEAEPWLQKMRKDVRVAQEVAQDILETSLKE